MLGIWRCWGLLAAAALGGCGSGVLNADIISSADIQTVVVMDLSDNDALQAQSRRDGLPFFDMELPENGNFVVGLSGDEVADLGLVEGRNEAEPTESTCRWTPLPDMERYAQVSGDGFVVSQLDAPRALANFRVSQGVCPCPAAEPVENFEMPATGPLLSVADDMIVATTGTISYLVSFEETRVNVVVADGPFSSGVAQRGFSASDGRHFLGSKSGSVFEIDWGAVVTAGPPLFRANAAIRSIDGGPNGDGGLELFIGTESTTSTSGELFRIAALDTSTAAERWFSEPAAESSNEKVLAWLGPGEVIYRPPDQPNYLYFVDGAIRRTFPVEDGRFRDAASHTPFGALLLTFGIMTSRAVRYEPRAGQLREVIAPLEGGEFSYLVGTTDGVVAATVRGILVPAIARAPGGEDPAVCPPLTVAKLSGRVVTALAATKTGFAFITRPSSGRPGPITLSVGRYAR